MENMSEVLRNGSPKKGELNIFVHLLLVASLVLAYLVLSSILSAIVFAAVLASISVPFNHYLERKLGGRKNISALLVVFIMAFALVVPVLLLATALVDESFTAMNRLQTWLANDGLHVFLKHPKVVNILNWIKTSLPFGARIDVEKEIISLSNLAGEMLMHRATQVATNAFNFIVGLFMFFFILFYFIRDGKLILDKVSALTPLERNQDLLIITKVRQMSKSVFVGTFITALAQGVVGGIGFIIVGLPGLFWGAVMAMVSLIPVVGTALVWVPAVLYLVVVDKIGSAVFMLIWGALLIGAIDNYVRPFLMHGKDGLSPLFVFVAIIGGMNFFGLSGVLFGPLILTFTSAILDLYKSEFLLRRAQTPLESRKDPDDQPIIG